MCLHRDSLLLLLSAGQHISIVLVVCQMCRCRSLKLRGMPGMQPVSAPKLALLLFIYSSCCYSSALCQLTLTVTLSAIPSSPQHTLWTKTKRFSFIRPCGRITEQEEVHQRTKCATYHEEKTTSVRQKFTTERKKKNTKSKRAKRDKKYI